jgi:hypothetical protein
MLAVLLALLAAVPDAPPVPGGLAALTRTAERIPLPSRNLTIHHDALLGAVEIDTPDPKGLAAHLAKNRSFSCPIVETRPGGLRLRCTTRRFEARLVSEGRGLFLELHELRGVPASAGADDGPPAIFYDPKDYNLGGSCPGNRPAARAECLLALGKRSEAAVLLRQGISGDPALASDPAYAQMRLGDLALSEGQRDLAASWYLRAQRQGVFARLAAARECELTGSCFTKLSTVFSNIGLPEPARTEMELREIRTRMLLGETGAATELLTRRLHDNSRPAVCNTAPMFCRRLALAALREGGDAAGRALALYLDLPERDSGPLSLDLAREAAEVAASLGAPGFGANLLAAGMRGVPQGDLDRHLARTAELYLCAGQLARASIVVDYAHTRLTPRQLAGGRWKALAAGVSPTNSKSPALSASPGDAADELARAAQIAARAHSMRSETP